MQSKPDTEHIHTVHCTMNAPWTQAGGKHFKFTAKETQHRLQLKSHPCPSHAFAFAIVFSALPFLNHSICGSL